MTSIPAPANQLPTWAAGYDAPETGFDELLDAEGRVRSNWASLTQHLAPLDEASLRRQWDAMQRQLFDDGVTYNPHQTAGASSMPWSLDVLPLPLDEREWESVADGLAQRARLLAAMLSDLFGPQRLLREGIVPPELFFGHPCYYPAYEGRELSPAACLSLYAADLSRAADGVWWVVGDRTRAPAGLGYTLENRIVASRNLPNAFRGSRTQRLARFFEQLRETLRELAPQSKENPRIVLWTKGPASQSYFEDSYLARYLGYTLAEAGDLAVRGGRLVLKTLGGLLPVEVVLRRIDDDLVDPVELRQDSQYGASGLMQVSLDGRVGVANCIGSRLVESPAFGPFLQAACKLLFSEELRLPSIASWWCGQPSEMTYVLDHFDDLLIRSAHWPWRIQPISPRLLDRKDRSDLIARIKARPVDFVGQSLPQRSTAPAWTGKRCEPRYVSLRTFALLRNDSCHVLPGALARLAGDAHSLDRSAAAGDVSKDVWITGAADVETTTLLRPGDEPIELRRAQADLPSRVVENLFWLGRYCERTEATARLLRAVCFHLDDEEASEQHIAGVLRVLAEQGRIEPDFVVADLREGLPSLAEGVRLAMRNFDDPRSLPSLAHETATLGTIVRDRLAVDAWRTLRRADEECRRARLGAVGEVLPVLDRMLGELTAFSGLASESMTRTYTWRFLDLGRRIERGWQTAYLLRSTLAAPVGDERPVLERVLRTLDCMMAYRSRYLADIRPSAVLDLLMCDETNPRSLMFQASQIADHVNHLPREMTYAPLAPEQRLAISLASSMQLVDVEELSVIDEPGERRQLRRALSRTMDQLERLSDAVTGRFFIHAGLPRHFALG